MIWPLTILPRFNGHPLPSDLRFDGLTLLITAASGGIGLAAAKSLAARGPSTLIITARDEKKASATKMAIEDHLSSLAIKTPPEIIALPLEMTDAASIHNFMRTLRSHTKHVDHAILNAGLINAKHELAPTTGYEVGLQVNVISTTFLALQLLPFLLASPLTSEPTPEQRPHLTFVSSGTAWMAMSSTHPNISPDSPTPLADLSIPSNFPAGTFGGNIHYGRTKLMLEHAMRRLAFLPQLNDPKSSVAAAPDPLVVVTSVCPGPTGTDLARDWTNNSYLFTFGVWLILFITRSAEVGSNIYISSLGKGAEVRGEMWKDDKVLRGDKVRNVKSEEGVKAGDKVWAELKEVLVKMDEGGEGVVAKMLG